MGKGANALGAGSLTLLSLVAIGVIYRVSWEKAGQETHGLNATLGADVVDEDFALFTHDRNELHCMERELRHPCVHELRAFIDQKDNTSAEAAALACVRDVLHTSTDYMVLKNMTHLLLDLDTNIHVFDKDSRVNDFVMTGIQFVEKLLLHDECLADFETKSSLETRCVPLYTKIAMHKYKNAGLNAEAKELFERVRSMSYEGITRSYKPGEAVQWDNWMHTPQIWVPGLRSLDMWPRELWSGFPIAHQLEENFAVVLEETRKALKNPEDSGFEDTYRFLYAKGEWSHIPLYHDRQFTSACEEVFPKTCALLKQYLPSKPGLPWTSNQNEQVMLIKMTQGTDVEIHSGPCNNILNIHLGIIIPQGARLVVANRSYAWQEGKAIIWDGSYDHAVDCLDCKEERTVLLVRHMHPDITPAHYKGSRRTHYEEVPAEMQ